METEKPKGEVVRSSFIAGKSKNLSTAPEKKPKAEKADRSLLTPFLHSPDYFPGTERVFDCKLLVLQPHAALAE